MRSVRPLIAAMLLFCLQAPSLSNQPVPGQKIYIEEYRRGQYASAEQTAIIALKANPNDIEARYYMACCLVNLGKSDDAIAHFRYCFNHSTLPELKKLAGAALKSLLLAKERALTGASAIELNPTGIPPTSTNPTNTIANPTGIPPKINDNTNVLNSAYLKSYNAADQAQIDKLKLKLEADKKAATDKYNKDIEDIIAKFDPMNQEMIRRNMEFDKFGFKNSNVDAKPKTEAYKAYLEKLDDNFAAQVAAVTKASRDEMTQLNTGTGDIRVVPSLSSNKVKNYINYSDRPESLQAKPAKSMDQRK